jgi:hypothetical protein
MFFLGVSVSYFVGIFLVPQRLVCINCSYSLVLANRTHFGTIIDHLKGLGYFVLEAFVNNIQIPSVPYFGVSFSC